jgi:hypothetical protein
VTADLDPPRCAAPAAHRRLGLVALVYAYRALAGVLIALPAALVMSGPTANWPRAQAELFEPGGVMLIETLHVARRSLALVDYSMAAIAAPTLLASVFPLAVLLAGLGREGRLSAAFLADRAWAHVGTLALIFGLGAALQGVAVALVLVAGGKLIGALKLAAPPDDLAFVALFAVALGVGLGLGVLRDLASVAAVRGEHRFYTAVSRALRCAGRGGGRALLGWAWRAALGFGGLVAAAWLSPAGAKAAAVVVGVALHQVAIAGATFAHASWLAAAMRLVDATEEAGVKEEEAKGGAPIEVAPDV